MWILQNLENVWRKKKQGIWKLLFFHNKYRSPFWNLSDSNSTPGTLLFYSEHTVDSEWQKDSLPIFRTHKGLEHLFKVEKIRDKKNISYIGQKNKVREPIV